MRKILILTLAAFALSLILSLTAQAQDKLPQKEPAKKAQKDGAKSAKPKAEKPVEESIDLDAFFKRGEENAKTSSCDMPAKSAEPIA